MKRTGKAPIEVEAKIMLSDCSELGVVEEKLVELGARMVRETVEEDTYFQHPCRDFASTDEALRLRISGDRVELTYKGPKTVTKRGVKARREVTVAVDNTSAAIELLKALGFRPVLVVRKHRRYYALGEALVSLDRVDELGCFVEIEHREGATGVEELISLLGLGGRHRIVESYLELLLSRKAKNTQAPR